MPIPDSNSMESSNKETCIEFFKKLFTKDELKEKIKDFSPRNVAKRSGKSIQGDRKTLFEILKIDQVEDKDKLAETLYDLVGPHFLYEVQGTGAMDKNSKLIRYEIFKKAIALKWFSIGTVNEVVEKLQWRKGKGISELEDINSIRIPGPWQYKMLELLSNDLPSETVEAPSQAEEIKDSIVTITAIRELKPLHDYQVFAGKKIRDLLTEQKDHRKRLLISIPTGAGKTRLVAESFIDWINDGKPSQDPRIHNSKYMVWIAQSRELCEQAISEFEEIYSQKGKSALTIFRLFGSRHITLESVLAQRVAHGLIVCTIDKIYAHIKDKKNISEFSKDFFQDNIEYDDKVRKSTIPQKYYDDWAFGRLRAITSCVVIDEAHKAIMPMYTCVLRGLGFNFNFTQDESRCNEAGITLIGLTATAFRGTGLERSRIVTIGKSWDNKAKLSFIEDGIERSSEINFPVNCTECKKPLLEGERVLQSTSKTKLLWHTNHEKLSAETQRIYSRFSIPLIPRIHGFPENKKPRAIITCSEKFVANDPIRISGEKSYDLLGNIIKYSWRIGKKLNQTEGSGMEQINEMEVPPKSRPTIVQELNEPGKYQISLTVENYDGFTDTATKIVEVIPEPETETTNEMKDLIRNLIKRAILCEVVHTSVKSGRIGVKGKEGKYIDLGYQIRKQAAENPERNKKLVEVVQYLLKKPQEKRKKILVFACDILHARFLSIWLKTGYDISADYVDSQLHASRNISRIRKFREETKGHGKVLINTNMLTTGFDVPDIDCVVMGRPVISTVEYTQMIGRGMRGTRMGGTKDVWIIDFDDQVQLTEKMKNQTIPLGWKSMAYDDKNKFMWKPLLEKKDLDGNPIDLDNAITIEEKTAEQTKLKEKEEVNVFSVQCQSCGKSSDGVLEISADYNLSKEDEKELVKFYELGIKPKLSVLKYCENCKDEIKIWPELNNLWRKLITQEKYNPVLIQLVKSLASVDSGSIQIDVTKILNPNHLLKKILEKNPKHPDFNPSQGELGGFLENGNKILEEMIRDAKDKIENERLGIFWPDSIIIQKNITSHQKLIELCDHFLDPKTQSTFIEKKPKTGEKYSLVERLRRETKRIVFDVLGFIPEEEKFKENLGEELYDFMLKKYITYNKFQQEIKINEYVQKIHERSECLDKVVVLYNEAKRQPDMASLEHVIPEFKQKIEENFDTVVKFLSMVKQIIVSARGVHDEVNFSELKEDYELVKTQTPWDPSTEEILRYSKIGIGSYMRYCGTMANFQEIYNLPEDKTRIELEQLKKKYFEIKNSINRIPDEETMRKHSDYSAVMEKLWFSSFEKLLEFLGQNTKAFRDSSKIVATQESKNKMIAQAQTVVKRNGMQALFEKIVREPELKFVVNFGSMEKFIEAIFPGNKQVALLRWKDIKKRFDVSISR